MNSMITHLFKIFQMKKTKCITKCEFFRLFLSLQSEIAYYFIFVMNDMIPEPPDLAERTNKSTWRTGILCLLCLYLFNTLKIQTDRK